MRGEITIGKKSSLYESVFFKKKHTERANNIWNSNLLTPVCEMRLKTSLIFFQHAHIPFVVKHVQLFYVFDAMMVNWNRICEQDENRCDLNVMPFGNMLRQKSRNRIQSSGSKRMRERESERNSYFCMRTVEPSVLAVEWFWFHICMHMEKSSFKLKYYGLSDIEIFSIGLHCGCMNLAPVHLFSWFFSTTNNVVEAVLITAAYSPFGNEHLVSILIGFEFVGIG